MRWGDFDALNHVTNARFVEFAREALVRGGGEEDFSWHAQVGSCDVRYHAPIPRGTRAVVVQTSLEPHQVVQRLYVPEGLSRRLVAEIATGLTKTDGPTQAAPVEAVEFIVAPRLSDAFRGELDLVAQFAILQEARAHLFDFLRMRDPGAVFAVASARIRVHELLPWGDAPLTTRLWFTRVGRSSVHFAGHWNALASSTPRSSLPTWPSTRSLSVRGCSLLASAIS